MVSRNHITDHGFACAFCVSCAGLLSEEVVQNYDIAGRSGLDTLRQWLDDTGMSFFECDNCQALHLPHMQNFDGVFDAKIDLIDNTILFSAMAEVRPSAVLPLAADLSAINASSLTVKAFLDMQG